MGLTIAMKKSLAFLIFLFCSLGIVAQIDYLEPVKSFSTYTGELGEYYRNVFSLLETGFKQQPYARFVVIPSFSPEYAMSVEPKNGKYCLVSNTLSSTYWQSEKESVQVLQKTVNINQSLYRSLVSIFRIVTSQIQDLDGSTAGLDGIAYYFASTGSKGTVLQGRKWSPEKGSLMERLVMLCQSAYLFSTGANISEETLTKEANSLLSVLQKRTKENPDAYKRPVYIGIYAIGPQLKTLSGKFIEEAPQMYSTTPEAYVEKNLIYPSRLLKQNVKGYALCEFTIDKNGSVLRPHILKATHPEFATEALRLVKNMPRW